VVNNHFHGPREESPTNHENDHKDHEYSLLTETVLEPQPKLSNDNHDYDEPYFEPACMEGELLSQLKGLGVPVITEDSLE
jgi:hypothetical protein